MDTIKDEKGKKKATDRNITKKLTQNENIQGAEGSRRSTSGPGASQLGPSSASIKKESENAFAEGEHSSHTFKFKFKSKAPNYKVVCNRPCTVLQALQTSPAFMKEEKSDSYLIIQRPGGGAVAPHFPCVLIKDEELLTIIPTASSGGAKGSKTSPTETKSMPPKDKCVTFNVDRRGGKNAETRNLLKDKHYKRCKILCVYGVHGDTVLQALQQDGRFDDIVTTPGCYLSSTGSKSRVEMETLVDKMEDNRFQICLPKQPGRKKEDKATNGSSEAESPCQENTRTNRPTAERDLYDKERMVTLALTQLVDNQIGRHFQITFERKKSERRDGSCSPEATNGSPPDEVAEQGGTPRDGVEEDTSQPDDDLSKGFEIAQEMRLKNENFGKIQPPFADFNRIRQITTLGESVCKVDVGGLKTGTGFVLFENFILTNAHLFENPCVRSTMTLSVVVKCIFNYEKCLGKKSISVGAKPVLIDYQFDPDETKRALDYAILELDLETMKPKNKKLPPGLLSDYGPVPDSGEACLIGHPQGGVKLLDVTSIIPKKNRRESVESVLMIKVNENIQEEINNLPKVVTYYTYFYHGSSGSPVFDAFGRVFGLHTASIYFRDGCSLIEYALPLEDIMKSFVMRLKRDGPEQLLSMVQEVAEKNLMLRECISRDIPEPMDH